MNIETIADHLKELLGLMTVDQRNSLLKNIRVQELRKSETVYHEGDMPTDLLCVVRGRLRLYKQGVSGRSHLIRVISPVSLVGYRAYFAGECYHSCAEAMEATTIVRIPLECLKEIILANAAVGWFFVCELSKRLGTANDRTVNLTQKHVRGRLAEALLFLRDNYGLEEDGSTLSIYLSREDMASMSNMTTANAIRTLSAFAQERIIAIDGRKIKLIDIPALKQISECG